MRKITTKLLFYLCILMFGIQMEAVATTVTFNDVITEDTVMDFNLRYTGKCSRMTTNADIVFTSDSAMVRVIMTDSYGIRRLLFEAYPLICDGDSITLSLYCDETMYMPYNTDPSSLEFIVKDAECEFDQIVMENKNYKNIASQREAYKLTVETQKASQMNQNLIDRGLLWRADVNEFVLMDFSKKAEIWGEECYNLEGYDYYSWGIFSDYSKFLDVELKAISYLTIDTLPRVKTRSFDWRKKHDANLSSSPYFDGNNDVHYRNWVNNIPQDTVYEMGNGWLTSVKSQYYNDSCGNGCYLFAQTASFEAFCNLFSNTHLDLNVSEQHLAECVHYETPSYECYTGGNVTSNFYNETDYCFIDQASRGWQYGMDLDSPSCYSGISLFKLRPDSVITVRISKRFLMKYGPMGIEPRDRHICSLVGFITIEAGDTIRPNGLWGTQNIVIPQNHPFIGRTAWIFKDSRGFFELDDGYATILSGVDGLPSGKQGNAFLSPLRNQFGVVPYTQEYHDYDNDGYYNWGIGEKPAGCPGPNIPDCNDNDSTRLYFDEYMFCTYDCDLVSSMMSSQPLYIDNDTTLYSQLLTRPIEVRNNSVLTFRGEFHCSENVFIQANIGSTINLSGASFFSICGDSWIGFKSISNLDPNYLFLPIGRSMIIANYSTIEDAEYGIEGDAGSIIRASNTSFVNNYCDIYLRPHTQSTYYRYVNDNNTSEFNYCSFYSDAKRHADTCIENVKLVYTKDVDFMGCRFEDEGMDNIHFSHENRVAINAYRSGFKAENNDFENCGYAIKTNSCLYHPINIEENTISDCHYGIYLGQSHATVVINNQVLFYANNIDTTYADVLPYAIYMDNSHDFQLEGNDIKLLSDIQSEFICGIVVNDCYNYDEIIYRNDISGMAVGSQAIGLNKDDMDPAEGLQISCNDYDMNLYDILVCNNIDNPYPSGYPIGIAGNQGSSTAPSGNKFTYNSSSGGQTPGYKTYVDCGNYMNIANNGYVNYYHHNSVDTALLHELRPDSVINVNRINTPNFFVQDSVCPDYTISEGNDTLIILPILRSMSNEITEIDNTLDNLIDGGNTSLTVAEIILANDNTAWQTYLELMDKSPYLSSESLKEIAKKEEGLTAPMVRDVLVANPQAAKDPNIMALLDERIDELPDYMIEQIEVGITEISPKEYLEAQKSVIQKEYSRQSSKVFRNYLRNPDIYSDDDIEVLLSIYPDNRSSIRLSEYYISKGNYLEAISVLNSIDVKGEMQQQEIDNLIEVYNIFNSIDQDSLDAESINRLLSIESHGGIAGSYAKGFLIWNQIIEYKEPVYIPLIIDEKKIEEIDFEEDETDFIVYPNPAIDYLYVKYELPKDTKNIMLKIISINGKPEKTIALKYTVDNKLIKLEDLSSGAYVLLLEANGKAVRSANISIVK